MRTVCLPRPSCGRRYLAACRAWLLLLPLAASAQDEVTAENLGQEILNLLDNTQRSADMQEQFRQIHAALRCDASRVAADTVLQSAGGQEA